jgi:uncharacterized protein YaiE (UPF0345 family)
MKTIADFKRRLAVGVKVHTTYHQESAGRDAVGMIIFQDKDMGIRPISIVQSTQFALKTKYNETEFRDSWMQYPKKEEFKILSENRVQILMQDFRKKEKSLIPVVTYTFI